MPNPTLFGHSFGPDHLQNAVEETIKAFLEDYLAEAERQRGLEPETLPVFKTYSQVNEFRNWADDETPVCVIVSPGIPRFKRKGRGEYFAEFDLGVACIVQANNREKTNALSRVYGPVIRQLMVQQAGLGGVASAVDLIEEKYDDVPESEDRSQAVAQIIFTVEVPDVVDASKGIMQPSESPYETSSEAPTAVSAEVEIEKKDEVGP